MINIKSLVLKSPFNHPLEVKLGKFITQDTVARRLMVIATVANIATAALVIFLLPSLPPQIPLFYSRPWGFRQLVPVTLLLIPPVTALAFLVINLIVSTTTHHQLLVRTLAGFSLFATLLGIITVIRILIIV